MTLALAAHNKRFGMKNLLYEQIQPRKVRGQRQRHLRRFVVNPIRLPARLEAPGKP